MIPCSALLSSASGGAACSVFPILLPLVGGGTQGMIIEYQAFVPRCSHTGTASRGSECVMISRTDRADTEVESTACTYFTTNVSYGLERSGRAFHPESELMTTAKVKRVLNSGKLAAFANITHVKDACLIQTVFLQSFLQ